MRKFFYLIAAAVLLVACETPAADPTVTLNLSPVTLTLKVGDIATIEATGTATSQVFF